MGRRFAVEMLVMSKLPSAHFWNGRRVFLTGHTGFKGGWMALWLKQLGATVCGYALEPEVQPSLFQSLRLSEWMDSRIGDIRDLPKMQSVLTAFDPSIVIHMAAQPLVRDSYADPVKTYSTNVMGTTHVLEIARTNPCIAGAVIVTSDKCYENLEQAAPYREGDRLGGRDPYSSSKACAEMIVSAYWWSYFRALDGQALASVRGGNVIGGGDWSKDRLVPDLIAAFAQSRTAVIRHPESVRPWQHVLELVRGYLLAAEYICGASATESPQAWNFGPEIADTVSVAVLASKVAAAWGGRAEFGIRRKDNAPHEATLLTLDHSKARSELGWRPVWSLDDAIQATVAWNKAFYDGCDMLSFSQRQLANYIDPHAADRTSGQSAARPAPTKISMTATGT